MSTLGIVIVNYNSTDYLKECLRALYSNTHIANFHAVVVDNDSRDRSFMDLTTLYRSLTFILNETNEGFSKGCNKGIRFKKADYYLLLNPDCIVGAQSIDKALEFISQEPEVGIVGGRVNNPDGSLQLACRRSIPRPTVALYRFTGLSRLFPGSKRFGAYNFTFMDPSTPHEVEAVSGSFLLFRHSLLESSGYLDESFFLYGEDLDFCYRATQRGWKVFYFPGSTATHYKRVSSSREFESSNFHFFNAMRIFYEKHFGKETNPVSRMAVLAGIKLFYLVARFRQKLSSSPRVGSSN